MIPEWQQLLNSSITTVNELASYFPIHSAEIRKVAEQFPFRINPYYLSLIQSPDDPIGKQVIPDIAELDPDGENDPLREEAHSPVPNLIHRYTDRVVFLVSNQCAVYCRFCTRKRRVGKAGEHQRNPDGKEQRTEDSRRKAIEYIEAHPQIRDVILSGGDPLLLKDDRICEILEQIRKIPHVEIIRIHTRAPCVLPQRITPELVKRLKGFHPLYINIHFNHPIEITKESAEACGRLADAGMPLGCQTVLLKGVNDDPDVMKRLMQQLLILRVKPYYLHQMDSVKGTAHFRVSTDKGLKIVDGLRRNTSGLCVPTYVVDIPERGKISLSC